MRKGNTTVYEWRTGSAPTKIERPKQVAHSFGDEDEQKNRMMMIRSILEIWTLAQLR